MKTNSSSKAVKAGAGYVIGNYLLKGITFLSAPIFSRLLEPADFSTYISYEAIIYIFVGLALHSSINNAKYKYEQKFNEYVSSIVMLVIISSLVWFGFANIFYEQYKSLFGFDRLVVNVLIVHCLSSALLQIYNSYISLNYSYKSFLKISSINAISNIVISIILILTVFTEQRSLGRIGTVLPISLIGIYIIVYFFRKAKPVFGVGYLKFGVCYSLPIIPHGVSQVILSTFDRIMIKDMIGSAEAGIYSFAFTIYTIFKVVVTSLENVWKPWIYEKMNAKEYNSIRKTGTSYAFGMALFTSLVIMVAPEMIKILGAKEYWGCTDCVVPVVLGGFFAFLYTLPATIEYFYSKTKYIAIGTMSAAALNIILNYIFIPKYGYVAAAYTTLVTYILYFMFHYIFARKIHGYSLFDTWSILAIAFGILVVGAVVIVLEKFIIIRWILEVVIGLLGLIWAERKFGLVEKVKNKLRK